MSWECPAKGDAVQLFGFCGARGTPAHPTHNALQHGGARRLAGPCALKGREGLFGLLGLSRRLPLVFHLGALQRRLSVVAACVTGKR